MDEAVLKAAEQMRCIEAVLGAHHRGRSEADQQMLMQTQEKLGKQLRI